jgi:hypothetical protein
VTRAVQTSAWRRPALAGVAALLAVSAVAASAEEAAGDRRGVQRNYIGARWSPAPLSLGWYATLRLDRAHVRDWNSGGFIAQTLWSATNEAKTAYGRNRRTPYIQIAISRGWRGHLQNAIVITQRSATGRYYEGRSKGPPVKLGQDYSFSLINTGGGHWEVRYGGDWIARVRGAGDKYGSGSAFAGIEASNSHNTASGEVKQLWWLVASGRSAAPFPRWRVAAHPEWASKLVRRGPGRIRWTDEQFSLRNSYGN